MTDDRILAYRFAAKACPLSHRTGEACPVCERMADAMAEYADHIHHELVKDLADLKDVGRAKAKMVASGQWTEPTAHRWIQKRSMDTRTSAGDIAREILQQGVPDGP